MVKRDDVHVVPGFTIVGRKTYSVAARQDKNKRKIQQRNYGHEYAVPLGFFARHKTFIVAALASAMTIIVCLGMLAMAIMVFPSWAEMMTQHGRNVAAQALGVAQ